MSQLIALTGRGDHCRRALARSPLNVPKTQVVATDYMSRGCATKKAIAGGNLNVVKSNVSDFTNASFFRLPFPCVFDRGAAIGLDFMLAHPPRAWLPVARVQRR